MHRLILFNLRFCSHATENRIRFHPQMLIIEQISTPWRFLTALMSLQQLLQVVWNRKWHLETLWFSTILLTEQRQEFAPFMMDLKRQQLEFATSQWVQHSMKEQDKLSSQLPRKLESMFIQQEALFLSKDRVSLQKQSHMYSVSFALVMKKVCCWKKLFKVLGAVILSIWHWFQKWFSQRKLAYFIVQSQW